MSAEPAHLRHAPSVAELLATPQAFLTRSHLRELGHGRRAVDAIFRACDVVILPSFGRPLIRVSDYLALIEESTYRRNGERVRAAA